MKISNLLVTTIAQNLTKCVFFKNNQMVNHMVIFDWETYHQQFILQVLGQK